MNVSLKKLLKEQNCLLITNKDDCFIKTISVLRMFFKEVKHTEYIKKAFEYYNNSFPNIIVLDINLQEYNGIDFIKEIRRVNKNIPIIVITSNKETSILIDAIKLNLIDYLLKPLDINKLIHALNQSAKKILNSGDIITDLSKTCKYNYSNKTIIKKNEEIKLTKNESRLLELFLTNRTKIVKIEDIKKIIWKDKEVSESAFKSLLSRLSNKVGKKTITNSFGIGYGILSK